MAVPSPGMTRLSIQQAISRALDFLDRCQLPDGEFKTLKSADRTMVRGCSFDSSPFTTSIAAYCLGFSEDRRARLMVARATGFLKQEMEVPGLWRYWSSKNAKHWSLPPDLDDTSCAAAVLAAQGLDLGANRDILLKNVNADGLFFTWVLPRTPAQARQMDRLGVVVGERQAARLAFGGIADDVDPIVNANALWYLGRIARTRPVVTYLSRLMEEPDNIVSNYYPEGGAFSYAVSRAFFAGVAGLEAIGNVARGRARMSLRSVRGGRAAPLRLALAACSLHNVGSHGMDLELCIGHLLQWQRANGSWQRAPMYLGPAPYYGSEELTTALCVEALSRFTQSTPY